MPMKRCTEVMTGFSLRPQVESEILTHLVTLDKTPPIHVNDQTPPLPIIVGTPQQIEPTNSLTEAFDDISSPSLLIVGQLSDETGFFAVGVTTYKTIHNR